MARLLQKIGIVGFVIAAYGAALEWLWIAAMASDLAAVPLWKLFLVPLGPVGLYLAVFVAGVVLEERAAAGGQR